MKILIPLIALCAIGGASAQPPVVPGAGHAAGSAGLVLLTELNCTACHASPDEPMAPKGGPLLDAVTARARRDYLEAFIADPAAVKPGTTMPHMLHALDDDERREAAGAIVDYLASLQEEAVALEPIDPQAVERGRAAYHRVGCVACHSPEEKKLADSPPLHRLEEKYSLASLTAFLEDPLAVRPGGRMPKLQLDHFEAKDIASFLLRDQEPAKGIPRRTDRADLGRELFNRHGCAQCHSPGEQRPDFAPALAQLDAAKDCPTAVLPLSEPQRTALRSACKPVPEGIGRELATQLVMSRLNCFACHERHGVGGVPAERDEYFTTDNLNLGNQARIPPSLTHVGAKLQADWLRKVLLGGASVRPYMHARMPVFGRENVEALLAHLPLLDDLPPPPAYDPVKDAKEARNAGFELVGTKNLACIACHTWKGESSTTLKGVELTTMAQRLQVDWFHLYMREPQKFHPTTIMPAFWPGGKPVRPEILDGDAGRQIDAIWQYLQRGREARTPHGIMREPINYDPPAGEAVIVRRQYRGIGKRGIGVGYPGGINIAFDASQMRLGSIWAGGFGEMSGVWRGQGSGNVNERSREVVRFPAGPGMAMLDPREEQWPSLEINQRAEKLRFRGYELDEKRRPTFLYRFGGIGIRDRFVDSPDGPSLTRTITLDKPGSDGLHLRIAADKDLEPTDRETVFRLPRELNIIAPPGSFLVPGDPPALYIPLAGRREAIIKYRFEPK